jgi:hypothetical protein
MYRAPQLLVALAVMALVAGCGGSPAPSSSADTSSAPSKVQAPSALTDTAWPAGAAAVRGMLSRLPAAFDGGKAEGLDEWQDSGSMHVRYNDDADYGNYPQVYVSPLDVESPVQALTGLWMWSGCSASCSDWASSPELAPLAHATAGTDPSLASLASASPSSPLLWFSFTATYDAENDRTFSPQEQQHVLAFTSGQWIYTVSARSDDQRDRLLAAMVAAVPGPPATSSPTPPAGWATDEPSQAATCSAADTAELARIAALLPFATQVDASGTPFGCGLMLTAAVPYATASAAVRPTLTKAGYGTVEEAFSDEGGAKALGRSPQGRSLMIVAVPTGRGGTTSQIDLELNAG